MSFGSALKDQLQLINAHTAAGLTFTNEIRDYLKERASIEKDYAHKLEQLTKRYSKQKEKLGPTIMGDTPNITGTDQAQDASKFGTFYKAWDEFLKQSEDVASMRMQLSDKIVTEITDSIKVLASKKEEARKKLLEERVKAYSDKDKSKAKYDESCDLVENSKNKYEKAVDEKMKEKLKKQWNQDIMEMNNIKNNYIMALNVANGFKKKYYFEDMPELMDNMQSMNESRVNQLKQLCLEYCRLETETMQQLQDKMNKMREAFVGVDARTDSNLFLSYHKTEWQEPYDFKFEPTLLWKDTDSLVTDEHSKIYLSNKVAKIEGKLEETEQEIIAKTKELEGLRNLHDAYQKNPSTGNADEVNENILEVKRTLTLLDGVKLRYTTSLEVIRRAIGDSETGKRHLLVKSAFAIPTTCDFCQEKIWGLTQQGLTCKDCGYNCHAKCEMKVPPYCTTVKGSRKVNQSSSKTTSIISTTTTTTNINTTTSVDKIARAIYDYEAQNLDELTIEVGDKIKVISLDDGTGWVKAEKDGKSGLIPAAYIQFRDEKSTRATVLYDYNAQNPDELTIVGDEVVDILSEDDGTGWLKAAKNGKQGLIPAAYVQLIK